MEKLEFYVMVLERSGPKYVYATAWNQESKKRSLDIITKGKGIEALGDSLLCEITSPMSQIDEYDPLCREVVDYINGANDCGTFDAEGLRAKLV